MASADEFELDTAKERVDLDVLWRFLSTEAYWARWRERTDVEAQVRSAWRVVGAYRRGTGEMVGFARAISDGVNLAYLADVFVLNEVRGAGVGKALVREMIDNGPGARFRWLLHTDDAHQLYRQFGFGPPDQTVMERPGARPAVIDRSA